MPNNPKAVDVVIVGIGAVGGIMAKQLASAGLEVVGLERGPMAEFEDYASKDTIRSITRRNFDERVRHEPISVRQREGAPSAKRFTSTPVNAVGGGLAIWTGSATRFMPDDFRVDSNEMQAGVADKARADLTGYEIRDWPISYDDLEPYYERFEWEMGVSGDAEANPFAGPRKKGYPLPPLRQGARNELFGDACARLGYHAHPTPNGILSEAYQPPAPYDTRIQERPACVYCGQCNNYGCHVQAKLSSAWTSVPVAFETGNFDLRTNSKVFRIETGPDGRATGVSYFDPDGNVVEQRAKVVIVASYIYEASRLLLLSGKGKRGLANSSGQVGRRITAHGDVRYTGIFDDYIVNGFIGPNSGMRMDDFNGNNFDHAGVGFIRGGTIGTSGGGTPLERYDAIPPGWPRWGEAYKEYLAKYYTRQADVTSHPETLPHRENYIDLDPRFKDEWGIPLPRTTFAFHQNEHKMWAFLGEIEQQILREAGASEVWGFPTNRASRWAGGTVMGDDASDSVVNGYCQSHDVDNLFVVGASVFPTMTGYAATPTVCALAYRTSEYILGASGLF
ncbi:MAG: GMC family oxidoreductase [Chloroflexi bacterium]|nr:GMC family oxidoreductase [Chloroflexota bacterium]MDA1173945.1 GMC family oxidoreductase [Chloroflexota bacterium]